MIFQTEQPLRQSCGGFANITISWIRSVGIDSIDLHVVESMPRLRVRCAMDKEDGRRDMPWSSIDAFKVFNVPGEVIV